MDLIDRQQAIDALGEEPYGDSDYEMGCRNQWGYDVEAIKELPSAELQEHTQFDCDMAYMQGKTDGIRECTERLRKLKIKMEADNDD